MKEKTTFITKYILLITTIVGYFLLSIFSFDLNEKNVSLYLGKKEIKTITLENINASEELLNEFEIIARDNNILLSISQRETINHRDYDVTYVSYKKMDEFKKILHHLRIDDSEYIFNQTTDIPNSSYFDEFLGNDNIAYSLLNIYWKTHKYSVPMNVHFDKISDYEAFIDKVSEVTFTSIEDIEYNAVVMNTDISSILNMIDKVYYVATFIIILSVGVIISYEATKRSKELAIKKLNGYSDKKLVLDGVKGAFSTLLGTSLATIAVGYLLFKRFDFVYYYVLKVVPILLFELLILIIIYCIFLKKTELSEIIKQKKMSTKIMFINNVLRFILLVSISSIFVIAISNFNNYQTKARRFKDFSEYREYLSFDSFSTTTDSEQEITKLMVDAYQVWNKKNDGLYSNFTCGNNDPTKDKCLVSQQFIELNVNYLENFKDKFKGINLTDFNGLDDRDIMYILIPNDKKHKKQQIEDDIFKYANINQSNIEFIEYDDVTLPTLSYEIIGDGNFTVYNPVVYVVNDYYYQHKGSRFFNSFAGAQRMTFNPKFEEREKVYMELVSNLNNEKYSQILKLNNFNRIDANISQEISSLMSIITILIGLIISLLIFYLILDFIISKMIIEDNKKEISIKYMNGYKSFEIIADYIKESFLLLGFAFILIIVVLSLILKFSWKLILINLGVIGIIEIFFMVIFYKMIISKKVIRSLKGEQ